MVEKDIEQQIRSPDMRKKYYELLEEDVRETLVPFMKDFVSISCPNCNRTNKEKIFKKGIFDFIECDNCGMLYISPRPDKKLLDEYYKKSKSMMVFSDILVASESKRKELFFNDRADKIFKYFDENKITSGRLLEVGCSIGTMFSFFKDKGFQLYGIDPDRKAIRVAEDRYGIKVFNETIEEYNDDMVFDVVVNFETLEHVFSPYDFLLKINHVMKRGGCLIFTTPNYSGFDIMELGRYYKNIVGPNHQNLFNVKTIDILLMRTGFKVVKKLTPGILDLVVLKNQVLSGEYDRIDPFVYHLLFNCSKETQDDFQRFLQRNLLSSNMMIFAEKIRET